MTRLIFIRNAWEANAVFRLISTLSLLALATSALTPFHVAAQTQVSPEVAQRLRDAVAREQAANGLETAPDLGLLDQDLLSESELDDLVAPVALYPDPLLAQVLVAAANPLQVAQAGELIEASSDMTDKELSDALAAQDWDPSVLVLLSGFPTVLARMAGDLEWTERLGAAMVDQDADVLGAVQRMRLRAEEAGNLISNEAQVVQREGSQIAIQPADRDVVYVPEYDPTTAYVSTRTGPMPRPEYAPTSQSAPASGFNAQNALIAGAVGLGAGVLVGELFGDDDGNDKNKNDKSADWDEYWRRDRPIDWSGRQVYARSGPNAWDDSWSRERDRYWDREGRRWRRDQESRNRLEEQRRAALGWAAVERREASREDRQVREWRENVRREAERERLRAAQRQERLEERRAEERRAEEQRRERAEARKAEERKAERREEGREAEERSQHRAEQRKAEERKAEQREAARRAAERNAQREEERKAEERKARQRVEAKERQAEEAKARERAEAREKQAQDAKAQQRAAAKRAEQQKAQKRAAAQREQAKPKRQENGNAQSSSRSGDSGSKNGANKKKADRCEGKNPSSDCKARN